MKSLLKNVGEGKEEKSDYFHWGAMITVLLILLLFVAANIYILISSYADLY